jgi:hypothetical protein
MVLPNAQGGGFNSAADHTIGPAPKSWRSWRFSLDGVNYATQHRLLIFGKCWLERTAIWFDQRAPVPALQ